MRTGVSRGHHRSPYLECLPFDERRQALAFNKVRYLLTKQIEDRRHNVDQLHRLADSPRRGDQFWIPHRKDSVCQLLVKRLAVRGPPMFPEFLSVIGDDHDQSVIQYSE